MSCSGKGCNLDVHGTYDKCILHCSKEEASKDYHMATDDLVKFKKELVAYITNQSFVSPHSHISKESVSLYLESNCKVQNDDINHLLKRKKIVFSHVVFPIRDERDNWDYEPILSALGSIHFNYCNFFLSWLDLKQTKCFFQDCEFYNDWQLQNYEILSNIKSVIYQECIFHKSVSSSGKVTLANSQFSNCHFKKELILEYITAENAIFNDSGRSDNATIKELKILKCIFNERFILNHYTIDTVVFEDSEFQEKFEFTHNQVSSLEINNCNFGSLAEFFLSKFEKFNIYKVIFNDYTGFENCQFGYKYDAVNSAGIATFKYTTFLNFVNFRNTYFFSGLDIDHANIKESPNFLNTDIDQSNTNRETFRVVKNSLDKIGNHIDANKFFALEMKKYKEELSAQHDKKAEKFIFWCNEFLSNFGQSYMKPMILLFITSIILFLVYLIPFNDVIFNISPKFYDAIYFIQKYINKFATTILPFNKILIKNMEFVSLIFYLINSILIWQIIIAVKRHTRR